MKNDADRNKEYVLLWTRDRDLTQKWWRPGENRNSIYCNHDGCDSRTKTKRCRIFGRAKASSELPYNCYCWNAKENYGTPS